MPRTADVTTAWLQVAEAGGVPRLDAIYASTGPQRHAIAEALQWLKPVESLLEVGCGVGNNLAMAETLGVPMRLGIEIDPMAMAYAAARVPCFGFTGDLRVALRALAAKSWDVALSCYALAYIAPEDLAAVLADLVRVTRRAIILAEPTADEPMLMADDDPPAWVHNYVAAAAGLSFTSIHVKMIAPVDRLDTVTVWRL